MAKGAFANGNSYSVSLSDLGDALGLALPAANGSGDAKLRVTLTAAGQEDSYKFAPLQALRQREGRVERHRYRLAVKVDLRGGGGNLRQVFGDIGAAFEADGGAFGHARLRPVRRLFKPDVICVDFLELFQRLFAVAEALRQAVYRGGHLDDAPVFHNRGIPAEIAGLQNAAPVVDGAVERGNAAVHALYARGSAGQHDLGKRAAGDGAFVDVVHGARKYAIGDGAAVDVAHDGRKCALGDGSAVVVHLALKRSLGRHRQRAVVGKRPARAARLRHQHGVRQRGRERHEDLRQGNALRKRVAFRQDGRKGKLRSRFRVRVVARRALPRYGNFARRAIAELGVQRSRQAEAGFGRPLRHGKSLRGNGLGVPARV